MPVPSQRLALPNPAGPVYEFTPEAREEGLNASRESSRRRMILPVHREGGDLVQRMVNFLQPGTYIQPHLHPREGASETILVMEGSLGMVIFEEGGGVRSRHRLRAGGLIDIEPRVWHGVLALAPDTLILEIKRGPYNAEDKVFADWAPGELDPGAPAYLAELESGFRRGTRSA